jgi:hypothetical protein
LETSFISLIKTSPSDLNSSDIKKISDPELKALFDFFSDSTNWKELSFIKNKDFMFELISYILKNKSGEFNSYSELYNYLNPEIKNVPDINKLFILYNPQNISYISNDFIND